MDRYQRTLSVLLWLRLVRLAYAVSQHWEKSGNMLKVEAAIELQQHLINHYGYHECPHCHWATRSEDGHIHTPGHPCATAHLAEQLEATVKYAVLKVYSGAPTSPEGQAPNRTIH